MHIHQCVDAELLDLLGKMSADKIISLENLCKIHKACENGHIGASFFVRG
jgi:hypothetical protein